jgi:protein-disulfide isomerase
MKPFYIALAVIAVLGAGAIVYATRGASGGMATEPLDLSQVDDASTLLERARGVSMGEENAPVQVLVFSDYMCPGCAHWAGQIETHLKRDFIESGRVRLVYYDFPLPNHRHSFLASRAARCAGDQDRFWEYHDRLFAMQSQWSFGNAPPTDQFMQFGRDIGLDARAFESCLRSDEHAEVVTANRMLGETLRVNSTPTVFLNSRQLRNDEWGNYEAVRAAVQSAGGV